MSPPVTRAAIVAEARSWLGTPYRHQASLKGVGCDCLGLVRGIWRACLGDEPEALAAYTPHWAEVGGEETLLAAAGRHLVPVPVDAAEAGTCCSSASGRDVRPSTPVSSSGRTASSTPTKARQ